jgi:carbon monoxide dehydrogenase subunit G
MIINNEFTVGADVDTVWRHLLDMEGVASCLPGATVTATDRANTYDGTMRLKIGPMKVEYRGSATLHDIDEHHHTAVMSLSAREAKGQGTAMATIRNQLETVDGGTRVRAETDLNITGPQAQFGRGVIEDVGGRVMNEFSRRLEEQINGGVTATDPGADGGQTGTAAAAEAGDAPTVDSTDASATSRPDDDALDLGAMVPRGAIFGVVAAVAALVLVALVRRRR